MSFYNKILTPEEKLIRGAQLCDVVMIAEALNANADPNCDHSYTLTTAITGDCDHKHKKQMINLLLENGAMLEGPDTMLSLAILRDDKPLVSFFMSKINDPSKEGFSLLHALHKKDCDTVWELLDLGIQFSEDVLEYASEISADYNISAACHDLYELQHFNATMQLRSDEMHNKIIGLEETILSGYGICNEFDSNSPHIV